MRITGGKARGIPLTAPKGDNTRPATDRIREAVFSSLGPRIEDSRIADLFAGTGAYGLEAMSRGASSGLFIENSPNVVACLRKNLAAVAKSCSASAGNWRILAQRINTIPTDIGPFDIVFLDPPYAMIEERIPAIFTEHVTPIVTDDGLICFEMPGHLEPELTGWQAIHRLGKAGTDKPTAVFYQQSR